MMMKKKHFVSMAFLAISLGIFNISWDLVFPYGMPGANGISYSFSASACNGVASYDFVYRPNLTLPTAYYFCNGPDDKTEVHSCAEGLFFKPSTTVCDALYAIDLYGDYPGFDWYNYLLNNPH